MDEDWYTVEQQIRDRLTEARAAARIRALTEELAPTRVARPPSGSFVWRAGSWLAQCSCLWSSHARWPGCERRWNAARRQREKGHRMCQVVTRIPIWPSTSSGLLTDSTSFCAREVFDLLMHDGIGAVTRAWA